MKVFALAPLLALLAFPAQAPAHPHDNGADESQAYELGFSFFPPSERLEAWARGSNRGARLGVGLGGWAAGAVEGLSVMSVTPGGPAELAGLRSGDMLTTFNGEPLASESGQESYEKLLGLLSEVEPGHEVTVGYRRGEEHSEAGITTDAWARVLAGRDGDWQQRVAGRARDWTKWMSNWSGADGNSELHVDVDGDGGAGQARRLVRIRRSPVNALTFADMAWRLGGLEVAELTPELGEYFGAERGLLVVRAPDNNDVPLQDGDVIQKIGGREFRDARHATRILRSYEPGEQVELQVLRHKRRKVVSFTLPERERGFRRQLSGPERPAVPVSPEDAGDPT